MLFYFYLILADCLCWCCCWVPVFQPIGERQKCPDFFIVQTWKMRIIYQLTLRSSKPTPRSRRLSFVEKLPTPSCWGQRYLCSTRTPERGYPLIVSFSIPVFVNINEQIYSMDVPTKHYLVDWFEIIYKRFSHIIAIVASAAVFNDDIISWIVDRGSWIWK